jgi:hypothetical protein
MIGVSSIKSTNLLCGLIIDGYKNLMKGEFDWIGTKCKKYKKCKNIFIGGIFYIRFNLFIIYLFIL